MKFRLSFIALISGLLMVGLSACGSDNQAADSDAAKAVADTAAELQQDPPPPQSEEPNTESASESTSEPASEASNNDNASQQARVYIVSPADGSKLSSPVRVEFGIKGMQLAPAGEDVPNSGHHHLLIDVDTLPPMNLPIPSDANHVHFGKAQTETEVELAPGTHTLQLLLGDKNHIPHDPPVMSEQITITVE